MEDPRERWARNPFFVLGLAHDASRADIEKTAQKLLAMLGVNAASAATYATPFGDRPRDAQRVREAVAELRDPARRIEHAVWARVGIAPANGSPANTPVESLSYAVPDVMARLGWRALR